MRQAADARRGAARLLTALAVLLPAATSAAQGGAAARDAASATVGGARDLAAGGEGRRAATRFNSSSGSSKRLSNARRLQEDGCVEETSVGDAEAGIAQYDDPEACLREGPLVGCNGECCTRWRCHVAAAVSLSSLDYSSLLFVVVPVVVFRSFPLHLSQTGSPVFHLLFCRLVVCCWVH